MHGLVDKAAFLAGTSCRTQGWFVHRASADSPGPGLQWRFFVGMDIARRARAWLGNGRYLPSAPTEAALQATADAVRSKEHSLLFEASFSWGGLIARADALRYADGGWTLIEVKSGKSPAESDIKDEYLDDIAYTACVAMQAGLPVLRAALVLVNRDYRLDGDAPMFVELDVTPQVMERVAVLRAVAQEIASAVGGEQRPEPTLQFACRNCDAFAAECLGKDVPGPLFILPRLSEKKFTELQAYERVSQLPATAKLTDPQQRVADVLRSGRPQVAMAELTNIMGAVVWPARYLDFEAVMPHLPWFEASSPYEAVPFQYSLHIRQSPADMTEHREYLAAADGDWRRHFTEQLLADLGATGSIVVYSSYEKVRLNALAVLYPDLRDALGGVVARLFDLERVFRDAYCHPGFAGRTSIKKVLPVMVPELRYDTLAVSNGDDAAGTFALMRVGEYPTETHDEHRAMLLEYCKLDTAAMVRLHEAVLQVLRETQTAQDG